MTITNENVTKYQNLYKNHLGIAIDFEKARIEATHLVRIIRILKRRSV